LKVQIIQLNAHDDHVSARDKMAWSRAHRMVLVWPERGRLLDRLLDLMLLQRQATRQGAQLGIVCQDPEVIEHARTLGIACFSSTQNLSERTWKSSLRRRPKLRRPSPATLPRVPPARPAPTAQAGSAQRLLAGGLALGALLSLAGALVPAAEVRLHPATQPLSTQMAIQLMPGQTGTDLEPGTMSARALNVEFSTSGRLPASGSSSLPDQPASGIVTLTNLTDQPLTIAPGTGIRAGQVPEAPRFVTLQTLEVAAGPGSAIEAAVVADSPGVGGNLPAHSLDSVEGEIGLSLSADNQQPMSGGTQRTTPAITAGDLEQLQKQLTASLIADATAGFRQSLLPGEELAPGSVQVATIEQANFDHAAGDVAESVGLDLRLSLMGLAYKTADLDRQAASALQRHVPEGWELIPESPEVQVKEAAPDASPGSSASLAVQIFGKIYRPMDENGLRQQISGLTPDQAAGVLDRQLYLLQFPSIRVHPSWYPRLPWLPMRISIELQWDGG
jgi:hypothetical protein